MVVASDEELREVQALYEAHFDRDLVDIAVPDLHRSSEGLSIDDITTEDLGVGAFRNDDYDVLNQRLGWQHNRPILFNEKRSILGYNYWDDADKIVDEQTKPLELMWHQMVGIAAIARKLWQRENNPAPGTGVLLADAVGVGKTFTILGCIALIIDTREAEVMGKPRPKIISEFDRFCIRA